MRKHQARHPHHQRGYLSRNDQSTRRITVQIYDYYPSITVSHILFLIFPDEPYYYRSFCRALCNGRIGGPAHRHHQGGEAQCKRSDSPLIPLMIDSLDAQGKSFDHLGVLEMNRRAALPAVAVVERGASLASAPDSYSMGRLSFRIDVKSFVKDAGFIVPEGAKVYIGGNAVNGPVNLKPGSYNVEIDWLNTPLHPSCGRCSHDCSGKGAPQKSSLRIFRQRPDVCPRSMISATAPTRAISRSLPTAAICRHSIL